MPTMEWVQIMAGTIKMYYTIVKGKTYIVQRKDEHWIASKDGQLIAGPYMRSWDAMEACAAAAGYGRVDHHWRESKL